jgi:hypothetical protein
MLDGCAPLPDRKEPFPAREARFPTANERFGCAIRRFAGQIKVTGSNKGEGQIKVTRTFTEWVK